MIEFCLLIPGIDGAQPKKAPSKPLPSKEQPKQYKKRSMRIYKLPVALYQAVDEPCQRCDGWYFLKFTHIAPIVNTDGVYIGQYWLQGHYECDKCGLKKHKPSFSPSAKWVTVKVRA